MITVQELPAVFILGEDGLPIAFLFKPNGHVLGFEAKEFTSEKFKHLLESLVQKGQQPTLAPLIIPTVDYKPIQSKESIT